MVIGPPWPKPTTFDGSVYFSNRVTGYNRSSLVIFPSRTNESANSKIIQRTSSGTAELVAPLSNRIGTHLPPKLKDV